MVSSNKIHSNTVSVRASSMPRYVKTSTAETDSEVLTKHPFAQMWRDYVEWLPYLPQFQSTCANDIIYKHGERL